MQKNFFIKTNSRYIKINFNDILYIEGCKNYSRIVTEKKNYLVLITMKRMEQVLPAQLFLRIHKSYIISLDKITEFSRNTVLLRESVPPGKEKLLPIGQQYKGQLERTVNIVSDERFDQLMAVPVAYLTQKAYAG